MSTTGFNPKPISQKATELDLDLLPPLLRALVKSYALQYQIDAAIPFGIALGCIATAMRGKVRTLISPSWIEHSSLYVVAIADTGDGKSQVMNRLRQPLIDYEVQLQSDAKSLFNLKQNEHEIAQAQLKAIKDSMANIKKSKSTPATQTELQNAIDAVEKSKPDPIPMLLCGGDVTPDRLTELLQEHKSLGILDAEGTLFSHLSGKKHNTGAAWETILAATSGDQIKSHRIGRGDGVVSGAHLIICTAVQPDVWSKIHNDASATNRGVTGRFVVMVAQSNIGWRDTYAHENHPIDLELMHRWGELLRALLAIDHDRIIELSENGKDHFQMYRDAWEIKMRDPENRRDGFGSRLPGNLIRLATLFTLSENPAATMIDDDALLNALDLGKFFLDHRTRADGLAIERLPEQRILDRIAAWMEKDRGDVGDVNQPCRFKQRDLQQAMKQQTWLKEGGAEALKAALVNLEIWGWLERDGDGKDSEVVWFAHPDLPKQRW